MQNSAPSPNSGFPYTPLGPGEIRLLKFRSSSPELAFDLVHEKIRPSLEYAALSYVWGNSPHSNSIRINDQVFWVQDNLLDALHQFSRGLASDIAQNPFDYAFWIDAICIDQGNINERNAQVQLMTAIYNEAHLVFVWLGKPPNETNNRLAIEKMKTTLIKFVSFQGILKVSGPRWWPKKDLDLEKIVSEYLASITPANKDFFDAPGTPTHCAFIGIESIFLSPWWTRCWAYQEGTVPEVKWKSHIRDFQSVNVHLKVVFVSGDLTTSWAALEKTLTLMNHILTFKLPDTPFSRPSIVPMAKVLVVRLHRQREEPFQFLELLRQFRQSQCKDPRDKVFAPLGLATESLRQQIRPDYNSSVLSTYVSVVKIQLGEPFHALDFLGHIMKLDSSAGRPSAEISYSDWPSWVPNWNEPLGLFPIPKLLYKESKIERHRRVRIRSEPVRQSRTYNASRNASSDNTTIDGAYLHLEGIFVDSIAELILIDPSLAESNKAAITRWVHKVPTYFTGEKFHDALNRTQCLDLRLNSRDDVPIGRNGKIDYKLMRKKRNELRAPELARQIAMNNSVTMAGWNRAYCLTRNNFLGMVPKTSKIGDNICVFFGGQVLYTTRPKGSFHEYIGECYLHGLMDGEVMQWLQDGNVGSERITLV